MVVKTVCTWVSWLIGNYICGMSCKTEQISIFSLLQKTVNISKYYISSAPAENWCTQKALTFTLLSLPGHIHRLTLLAYQFTLTIDLRPFAAEIAFTVGINVNLTRNMYCEIYLHSKYFMTLWSLHTCKIERCSYIAGTLLRECHPAPQITVVHLNLVLHRVSKKTVPVLFCE